FLLGGDTDGIQQIGDILQKHPETDTLHIISHGSPGCLYLGNSQLSLDTLKQYAPEVQLWDIDNLVLYGCYVAAGDAGEEFVGKLSGLMGANIAASKTLTGSAPKGGNWELEVNTGQQRPTSALQTEVVETYSGVLVYNEKIISNKANAAVSVFAADVDGDGNGDIISASFNDNKITLYLNDGSNNFTEETISTNAKGAYEVFAADVNGDGNVDVLSASKLDDKIAMYLNDGSNNFTEHIISSNADGARSVFAEDMDGDGDVDVLSASESDDKIALYLNEGSNNFTKPIIISSNADGAYEVFAADVDGDNDVDVLSASWGDDKITLYVNEGSNKFREQTISTNVKNATSVFVEDVDSDGDGDILSTSYKDNKIALYLNDGRNNFTEKPISTNAKGAKSVFAADLDNDGDVDVLSASQRDNKIALYETVSVTVPTVSINAAGTPTEAGATPGTFTIDRGADTAGDITVFFTISGNAQQNIDYDIQGVRTLENTFPTVTFDGEKGSVVIPNGQTSVDIKITPRDDVVADAGETVTLTLTEEPTGAPEQYDVSSTPGDKTATLTITDNTNPSSKVVGANEIIISNTADGANTVFAADVNGDGNVDVLSASFLNNTIALYLNDGNNNFTEEIISTNANGPRSLFAADVDGDGNVDVLSASFKDNKIALYLNNGSNNFTEQTISTNANGAKSVFAADVDGDGDVDVLSASESDDKIALYLNDGSNNFTEQTISTNADGAYSVFAADVDGDGDVDVLSASQKDHKIALYLNDGSNNFTEQTISNNALVAFSVFAADMDSDGDVDVLSASWLDDKIALYETVPLPNVSINAAGTPKERGETTGTFTIDRGTDTAGDLTVYFTISGNATEGTDYTTVGTTFTGGQGSVVIPAGKTSVDIEITAKCDKVNDPNEKVTLTLTKDPKYDVSSTPGDETATLTIENRSTGTCWGDVHFVTFDGRKYDLQSSGDFILAETARKDDDWIVQTRQDRAFWNPSVSVNTAFATLVDGQKVVFNTKFPNNRLQIDGVDFPLANGETKSIGNSKIERYNNKYTIKYAGNDGIIDIDDPQLIAFDHSRFLNIHIPNFDTMQGLLGNNDGDPTNDFALRNGTQLPNNLTAQEIHNTYGESWRVQPEESLFENSAPNIDIPKKFISLEDFPQDQVQAAKNKVFAAGIIDPDRIDAVALDILATGDEIFLTSAVEFFGFIDGTINSPPTDLNLDNTTILENAVPNSLVGTLSTTDPDNEDSFTYGLVAGEGDIDNSAFTINGDQLQINDSPDYETKSNYNIRVQTTDGEGASYQEQLTINVKDIIKGTAGRDTLTGTDDNDVIIGFQGRDIITGGEGEDQFVYINMRDTGDIITDFEVGSDKIVLTELFNSIGYSGS
ncbi:MAG: FG-GAP-like repeat-containing protein, partial [Trichodesmium sp. St18_bin1]|nr:FG-GAP-like repeat-containing protein [Trichodesmium sp. St18_bin1]